MGMAQPPTRPRRPSTASRHSTSQRTHVARAPTAGSASGSRTPVAPPRPSRLRRVGLLIEIAIVAAAVFALWLWLSVPDVSVLADKNPPTTAFIELRKEQARVAHKDLELAWTWKPLDRISVHLRRAVVITEDWNFWSHDGVDWNALEQAVDKALEDGELSRGGSTITQQLAKNLYLSPDRSLVRKLREMLIAFRLEDELPKQRILEIYLNVAEWGDGIFGAEAAARHYYQRSAADLSPAQAARLAIALPNPFERSPAERSRQLDRRAGRVLRMMRGGKAIDEATLRRGFVELGLSPAEEPAPASAPEAAKPEAAKPAEPEPSPATAPEPAPAELPMPPEE
jgi:monofunctional glycosyltransferase